MEQQEQAVSYSIKVIQEAAHPKNMARMVAPDVCGIIHGCCGDTMEIYLRLTGDRIKEATFMTDGQEPAIACGSILTTMLPGLLLEEAEKITAEDLIAALDGLPQAKVHCAKLMANTLQEAVANWRSKTGNLEKTGD